MPDLHMHFVNMGFDTSMYASSWFLTLFLTSLPLELANRIMDLFLVDVNSTFIYLLNVYYIFFKFFDSFFKKFSKKTCCPFFWLLKLFSKINNFFRFYFYFLTMFSKNFQSTFGAFFEFYFLNNYKKVQKFITNSKIIFFCYLFCIAYYFCIDIFF
jgi:hypothetical protein